MYVQHIGVTQLEHYAFHHTGLIADVGYLHAVGTAGAHTLHVSQTGKVGHSIVLGSRGEVCSHNRCANERFLGVVGHRDGESRSGDLGIHGKCCEEHNDE